MKQCIFILLLILNLSCSGDKEQAIDSLWDKLIEVNGCLVGEQYETGWFDQMEHSVMHEHPEWKKFFTYPRKDLTRFLVTRLGKTNETRTHTCPYFITTEGELAIYALQKIHRKNWFDFPMFQGYKDKDGGYTPRNNAQQWLQDLLNDPETRAQLAELWLNCIN